MNQKIDLKKIMFKKKPYINFFYFLVTVFCCFEFICYYGHFMFPLESYQKYSWTKSIKEDEGKEFLNEDYIIKINGRGAIGSLFHGQKIQISFFGNSSLFYRVSQNETWPEQIKIKLGEKDIHIDNFAVASNDIFNMKKQIKSLCRLHRFYDIVVIQYTVRPFTTDNVYYYKRWLPHPTVKIQSIQKIREWIHRMEVYPFSDFFPKLPFHLVLFRSFLGASEDLSRVITKKMVTIQSLLDSLYLPSLKELFILESLYLNELKEVIDERLYEISQSAQIASCITKNIIWLPEPIMLSKETLKHYKKYYPSLSEELVNQLLPIMKQSVGKGKKIFYHLTSEEFKKDKNVVSIDWRYIFYKESFQNELFLDIEHLSKKGHKVAAEFMYPVFYEMLKDNL